MDEDGTKFTNLFLFNENMLHLVDDIFWNLGSKLGFKSAKHAKKVMNQVIKNCDIAIIAIIFIISG